MKIGSIAKKIAGYKAKRQTKTLIKLRRKREILEAKAYRVKLQQIERVKIAEAKSKIYGKKGTSNKMNALAGFGSYLGAVGKNINKGLGAKKGAGLNLRKGLRNIKL